MMMDKRLMAQVPESRKYIMGNVLVQWIGLVSNIIMMTAITKLLAGLFYKTAGRRDIIHTAGVSIVVIGIRFFCAVMSAKMSYRSSEAVKKKLRQNIYEKLLRLGASYDQKINTSEIVQLAVEGVDQLETYFGADLPQLFYAMLAPLTLFLVLSFINLQAAVVLLVCVPLIPAAIAAVQSWAKKLLAGYWGQYTALGDTFLENLQGLTTLKIYQSDAYKNEKMNEESEQFRKITMEVLTMQLNSITIMDVIAYGGAALGVIMAALKFSGGNVTLEDALLIILLAADFFIPMRLLGSFFHIAMNGMAASGKIFRLLDLPENCEGNAGFPESMDIRIKNVDFSYEENREILHGIDMEFPSGSFTSIVGESGCGKSTIASILMRKNRGYKGSIQIGHTELSDIYQADLMKNITYISHNSYLFKGTVKENLLLAKPDAGDEELWEVLEKMNLSAFLRGEKGLETEISEKGSNLSGGQCQWLALIRDRMFQALRKLSPAKLEGKDKGDLISVITSDIELLEVFYAHTISPAVIACLFSVIMCGYIGSFHVHLGIIALAAYAAVGIAVPIFISGRSGEEGIKLRSKSGELAGFVLDSFRGLSETIQYDGGKDRLKEMNQRTKDLSVHEKRMKELTGQNTAVSNTIILIFDLLILFYSGMLYSHGQIGFEAVLLPTVALMGSFGPVAALANLGSTLQNTFAAGNRVIDILEENPMVEEITDGKDVIFHSIEAEDVTFAYDDETILDHVSLKADQGKVIGIVGKSGCGKSTLLKLFMRFWETDSGNISISDVNINQVNTDNLRCMEGYMTQETHLFHDTIENNLKIARLDADHEEIVSACKKASIHDFIMTLPKGYGTEVGELGDTLSGGEKQRIGLARAFLHDAPLMLLDEPTSNLDSLNEGVILKSLCEAKDGKTVILVSHRESTMRIADRVYSMADISASAGRQS